MDLEFLQSITKFSPIAIMIGYFNGTLYEITDKQEKETYRYPIALPTPESKIVGLYVTYQLSDEDTQILKERLIAYEGPLYKMAVIPFVCASEVIVEGYAFLGEEIPSSDPRLTCRRCEVPIFTLWQ